MADQTDDAMIRYGVKELLALQGETLKRIESKVDGATVAQAEINAKFDLRLALVEALNLGPRVDALEKFRWGFPSLALLAVLVSTAVGLLYIFHP